MPIGEACLVSTLSSKAKKLKASANIREEREVEDSQGTVRVNQGEAKKNWERAMSFLNYKS